MTPAKKDCDQYADGYAGKHGGFAITWQGAGWWVVVEKTLVGPSTLHRLRLVQSKTPLMKSLQTQNLMTAMDTRAVLTVPNN
jgi:hypothetical protein